jgi:2'-hydroxyisoflavone reductase
MKILMIGGTVFLGRHTVAAALAHGHTVTLFNRGQHNPKLFPEVEKIQGDRDGGLDVLKGRQWDAVIDFCGYVPRVVKASAEFLAGAVERYVFISSVSVYAELDKAPDLTEDAAVGKIEDETLETITGESYGPLKALCEQAVEKALPGRALIIRPGLIVGPNDPSDRFTYWPVRVARGGQVLCPSSPAWNTQIIDARDLAEWTICLVEAKAVGVYNATGPGYDLTFGDVIESSKAVSNSNAQWVWADDAWLLAEKVEPWMELPLWLGGGDMIVKIDRALATGLTFRPLVDTVRDTLAWHATRPVDLQWRAGLKAEKEAELLEKLQASASP